MFSDLFSNLKGDDKVRIINLMTRMEHSTPLNEIKIKFGLDYARVYDMELSINELLDKVKNEYKQVRGCDYGELSIIDTYHTMISRNTRNKLYEILLKHLCIDEAFIQEMYFSTLSERQLFDSLLPKDQKALLWYIENIYRSQEVNLCEVPFNLG